MKKLINAAVIENIETAKGIYSLWLDAPEIAEQCRPGQFVELYIDKGEHMLPRPISICDAKGGKLRVVFAAVGAGTAWLAGLRKAQTVNFMGALGNGFPLCDNKNVALAGGGIGVPPLYFLAKKLRDNNNVEAYLGFREAPILSEDFAKLGVKVHIATDNGAEGFKGNAVELLTTSAFTPEIIYACGPKPMLKGLADYAKKESIECCVSVEERMACGIGACVGCAIKTKSADAYTYKKVCADGPVFDAKEVVFE